jgi:hypothetical protein
LWEQAAGQDRGEALAAHLSDDETPVEERGGLAGELI